MDPQEQARPAPQDLPDHLDLQALLVLGLLVPQDLPDPQDQVDPVVRPVQELRAQQGHQARQDLVVLVVQRALE